VKPLEYQHSIWCPHSETTAPDEDGKAICVRCFGVIQIRLTLAVLQAGIEAVRRGR
jgi:hypothetical protein